MNLSNRLFGFCLLLNIRFTVHINGSSKWLIKVCVIEAGGVMSATAQKEYSYGLFYFVKCKDDT